MNFSKLLHGIVRIDTLLKVLHGLVKIVLCISRPLPNKTKISKLVQASAFELKVLDESKFSMPWIPFAFGNVCIRGW